jgi:hypothetical protein
MHEHVFILTSIHRYSDRIRRTRTHTHTRVSLSLYIYICWENKRRAWVGQGIGGWWHGVLFFQKIGKHEACILLSDVVLPGPPEVPQPSRWEKVHNANDFFALGFLLCGVLTFLIKKGWATMFIGKILSDFIDEYELGEDRDEEVRGSQRKNRVNAMLEDEMFAPLFFVFLLRVSIHQFYNRWLLHYSRNRTPFNDPMTEAEPYDRYPPICNLLHPVFSPITILLQYYGLLLTHGSQSLQTLQIMVRSWGGPLTLASF